MRLVNKFGMIRWHYFDYEIIDFNGKSSIITGDNATGKSTIIDALQVVLIGNLKTIKFNSSAHEHKTQRNLISYLRGKIGSSQSNEGNDGDFLRNEDFTSYLTLEVEIVNPKTKKFEYYILGAVFDYIHKNNTESHDFFRIDNMKLDEGLFFMEPELPRTKEQFFRHLKKEGFTFEKYQTIEKYNDDVRHLLGGIKDSFFSLLQKGISFSPITNLRKFVYDYILDADEIDVSNMQDYVEQTVELVDNIKTAEKQIEKLKEIRVQFEKVESINRKIKIGYYMEKRADYEHHQEQSKKLNAKLSEEKKYLIENTNKRENLDFEKEKLNKETAVLNENLIKHDVKLKQTLLNEQIQQIDNELTTIKENNKNIKHKMETEVFEYEELIKILEYLNLNNNIIKQLKQNKSSINDIISSHDFLSLPVNLLQYNQCWTDGYKIINQQNFRWAKEKEDLSIKKDELLKTIKQLESNQILSDSSPNIILKNLLLKEFEARGKRIPVDLLCEVIDVKTPDWRNAIEGYLNTQKFNILVPPGYFNIALEIYEKNKYEYNLENVGLVDVEKVLNDAKAPIPGSLAEEIIVEKGKEYIQPYVNYLLGRVIKCNNVGDIRKYRSAITSSCMLYQSYTARQIPKSRYNPPFIGKNAIQVQLIQKREELENTKEQIRKVSGEIELTRDVLNFSSSKEDRYKRWKEEWKDSIEIFQIEEHQSKLSNDLFSLDTSEIDELERRIQFNNTRVKSIDEELPQVSESIGTNNTNIERLEEDIKSNERLINDKKGIFEDYFRNLSAAIQILSNEKWENEDKKPLQILLNYQGSNKGLQTQKTNALVPLVKTRTHYNNTYLTFMDVENDQSNTEYDEILNKLEKSEIVSYKQKAEEAREKAEQSFREDFIARLKDQIEKARSDFKEMNSILRELKFGTDSYHFRLSPNEAYRDYYNMLNDPKLEGGYSLFSGVFDDEYGHVVSELFEKVAGEDSGKNADLLDYRTFLDFELEVTDETGKTTRYSKVALEKSGGETQVPFYVSILASFYHAYHMGRKQDSFRLVIFDEAFNRMDANRVEEAIKFIKNCGFQTIIVAPTGKVALLAPHFENSFIVMKDNNHSFIAPVAMNELLDIKVEDDL